jgi:hypothetical protein
MSITFCGRSPHYRGVFDPDTRRGVGKVIGTDRIWVIFSMRTGTVIRERDAKHHLARTMQGGTWSVLVPLRSEVGFHPFIDNPFIEYL